MMVLSWFVAGALAGGPELVRAPQPQYPSRQVRDASIERRCSVDVALDLDGHPATITPVVCDPEVADFTLKKLKKWRWSPPPISGMVLRVDIVYTPPSAEAAFSRPDYWRRNEAGECTAHLTVSPSGHAAILRQQEGCTATVRDVPAPPHPEKLLKHAPVLCDLTFIAKDGVAHDIERFRCPTWTWAWATDVLQAWRWSQRTDQPEPWSVILEIDGPTTWDAPGPVNLAPGESPPTDGARSKGE